MTDAPEPPPAEPPPSPPQAAPAPAPSQKPPWLPIMIGVAVAVLAIAAFAIWRTQMSGAEAENAYTVQPYMPPTELISARERAPGYEEPDTTSPVAVQFGQGVTLNVTGRVSRGLGGEWYAVAWNDRVVFVRQEDAVAGSGAPPGIPEREEKPEEEEEKPLPEEEQEDPFAEEELAEAPRASSGTLEISDVNWFREPGARDFARFYPREALEEDQSGRVVLDCVIGGGGRLDCSVAQESPGGYGFGRAAISIARQTRVDPTLPDGSSAAGRHLRLPLQFRAG